MNMGYNNTNGQNLYRVELSNNKYAIKQTRYGLDRPLALDTLIEGSWNEVMDYWRGLNTSPPEEIEIE